MARIAGRNGRIYLAPTSGGTAVPITASASWTVNLVSETIDVTSMGDASRQNVADLPDASGSWTGFYDDADTGSQIIAVAVSGAAVPWYLYPETGTTKYWYGKILLSDFSSEGGVGNAVTANVSWSAASNILFKSA